MCCLWSFHESLHFCSWFFCRFFFLINSEQRYSLHLRLALVDQILYIGDVLFNQRTFIGKTCTCVNFANVLQLCINFAALKLESGGSCVLSWHGCSKQIRWLNKKKKSSACLLNSHAHQRAMYKLIYTVLSILSKLSCVSQYVSSLWALYSGTVGPFHHSTK